ncbi:nitrate- and nitrite sensing domain-containing protein [Streptacidiphilus sp. EB129]|uniref:sensor histidine kinase n=1 Tax=Streptacidiphilus sp. EB129 TaxID=3156262 RepID=UPI003512244C
MQGRIKRGGGGPGDSADRGKTNRQQPAPTAPPSADAGRGTDATTGGRQSTADAAKARIGRLTPTRVTGMRRYALSNWRIRTRLTALLVLPVIAAIVLGGFRIQQSLQTQQQLANVSQLGLVAASATDLATALEDERDTMAGLITDNPNDPTQDPVVAAQKLTDTRKTGFTNLVDSIDRSSLPGNGVDILTIEQSLDDRLAIRTHAFRNGADAGSLQTVQAYDGLITPLLTLSQDLALASSNSQLIQTTRALQEFSKWKEDMSIIRATVSAGLASRPQNLTAGDKAYALAAFNDATARQTAFTDLYGSLPAKYLIGSWTSNTNIQRTYAFTNSLLNSPDPGFSSFQQSEIPAFRDWDGEATTQINAMRLDESTLVSALNTQTNTLRSQAQSDAIINAVLIALVLLVAVAGAALVARSMVRTLNKLQMAAEDVAEHRLPDLVRTLSESDPQDVDTSVAPIGINTTDEIGHVARAFDQVHAQAVRLAAEQALLRGNINAMFTNLSRRSQGLIQRQLSMISELESREADPDQLASLFKLDHLATRMRRNGENLLVLAGEDPGRRWTRPVPLVDVLRAAASEVEQYERIELASVPTADVAGRVVNDLVHLLAELLENATSFSSPQTRVRVTGHALPDGRVLVEIHDTGIGLSPDDLAEINERLANPPVVDVSVSRRMGLFVVGRLSLRHGIRIQLRPSDSGGTTALVMLPVDVTNAAERRGGAAPQGGPQRGGQGGPQVRGPEQRNAMPQAPGRTPLNGGPTGGPSARPSLPPQPAPAPQGPQPSQSSPSAQSSQQPGLPRRGGSPSLPPAGTDPFGDPQPPQQRPRREQPQNAAQNAPQDPAAGFGADGGRGQNPLPVRGQSQDPQGFAPGGRGDQGRGFGSDTGQTPGFSPDSGQTPGFGPDAGRGPGRGAGPDFGPGTGGPQRSPRPQQPTPPPAAPMEEHALWAEQPQHGSPAGRPQPVDTPDGTLQFARPHFDDESQPRPATPQPLPPRPVAPQQLTGQHGQQPTGQLPTGPQAGGQPYAGQQFPGQQGPGQQFSGQQPQAPTPALPVLAQNPMAQNPMAQTAMSQAADAANHPLTRALPPSESGSGSSPIFEAMESNWFRSGRADRMRAVQVYGDGQNAQNPQAAAPAPAQPAAPVAPQRPLPVQAQSADPFAASGPVAPAQPQAPFGTPPRRQQPERGFGEGAPSGATAASVPWRASANDEVWRRAEQVREPSAGGVLPSGLPRRVPQANLVPGQAESAPADGPQVSRSPEEVRGRLTNLRRGIQQGRQAGTGNPNQAGPNQGNGPYGTNPQER